MVKKYIYAPSRESACEDIKPDNFFPSIDWMSYISTYRTATLLLIGVLT